MLGALAIRVHCALDCFGLVFGLGGLAFLFVGLAFGVGLGARLRARRFRVFAVFSFFSSVLFFFVFSFLFFRAAQYCWLRLRLELGFLVVPRSAVASHCRWLFSGTFEIFAGLLAIGATSTFLPRTASLAIFSACAGVWFCRMYNLRYKRNSSDASAGMAIYSRLGYACQRVVDSRTRYTLNRIGPLNTASFWKTLLFKWFRHGKAREAWIKAWSNRNVQLLELLYAAGEAGL